VDAGMNVFGDYVRAGKSTTNQEAAVRQTYETYQQSMFLCRSAIMAYKANPNLSFPEQTLNLLSATAADLIVLIQQSTKQTVKVTP
jgi:hypothetical protein